VDNKENAKKIVGNVDEEGGAIVYMRFFQEEGGVGGRGQHFIPKFIILFFMTLAY
jgi:hypothetical protein